MAQTTPTNPPPVHTMPASVTKITFGSTGIKNSGTYTAQIPIDGKFKNHLQESSYLQQQNGQQPFQPPPEPEIIEVQEPRQQPQPSQRSQLREQRQEQEERQEREIYYEDEEPRRERRSRRSKRAKEEPAPIVVKESNILSNNSTIALLALAGGVGAIILFAVVMNSKSKKKDE